MTAMGDRPTRLLRSRHLYICRIILNSVFRPFSFSLGHVIYYLFEGSISSIEPPQLRLWPCKCLEVKGLLFAEFDISSSVISYLPHVSLVRFVFTHFFLQGMLKALKVFSLGGQGLK